MHALQLSNLLAHFPKYREIVQPIENYRPGELEECHASFYMGTFKGNRLPEAFLKDFATSAKRLAWLGYGIEQLAPESLKAALGARFMEYTGFDSTRRDAKGRPTFFRSIAYKGETFEKYDELSASDRQTLVAAYETAKLDALEPGSEVLAEAIHNGTGEKIPYAIRRSDRFYVADDPLTFPHERDRYLVFADLLFDILGELPLNPGRRLAVFRLEDVHSGLPASAIEAAHEIARAEGVTLHIALIPIFYDPHGGDETTRDWTPMNRDPQLSKLMRKLAADSVRFIVHGVTHQFGEHKNPVGRSGDDYEFWDMRHDRPFAEDSVQFLLDRLNMGWEALTATGLTSRIFEAPHYIASALDYLILARVFSWNAGRVTYFRYQAEGLSERVSTDLRFENSGTGAEGRKSRADAFAALKVAAGPEYSGQFFPYEIYGDAYGQRVIPENLGYVENIGVEPFKTGRTVDDLIADARRVSAHPLPK